MNRAELAKELEKLEEQARLIREKLDEPESVVWKPKKGEEYFHISSYGSIESFEWGDDGTDNEIYAYGNCYRTEQEAIDARDAKIILTHLQRMADEANGGRLRRQNEWKEDIIYYIYATSDGDLTISIHFASAIMSFIPCFKTWRSAKNALNALVEKYTEERVKMALSGVWR